MTWLGALKDPRRITGPEYEQNKVENLADVSDTVPALMCGEGGDGGLVALPPHRQPRPVTAHRFNPHSACTHIVDIYV